MSEELLVGGASLLRLRQVLVTALPGQIYIHCMDRVWSSWSVNSSCFRFSSRVIACHIPAGVVLNALHSERQPLLTLKLLVGRSLSDTLGDGGPRDTLYLNSF